LSFWRRTAPVSSTARNSRSMAAEPPSSHEGYSTAIFGLGPVIADELKR
jgi:hypothetical protein